VFLLTTAAVDRVRPAVPKLDPAPPTSSFPSGHTGAATALYVGVALLIASRVKPVWLKVLVLVLAALVPISVGLARLYRGMHHPTDVAFGAANGLFCALLVTRASAKQAAE
jgi:membrane-associated phospholipid phosphatase